MKNTALVIITIMSASTSCEKPMELTDPDVFFKIGKENAFKFDDIEL